LIALALPAAARDITIPIDTPMSPPGWALLQRQLLQANAAACQEFFNRYFDDRGWLLCVERWGGDDGPDDAIENCTDWPILHALGASDAVLKLYKKAWEGHLRQYTLAKTTHVPFAKDGMYYKEFPVMFDWLHNAEGLTVFSYQGMSDPYDAKFQQRARRYAGFYLNEDPDAPNYDAKHKIIRSMFNGSRGPLLRKANALDWAGDPFEIGNRFKLGHGERNYDEVLAHFKDYNDVVGDHPQNLMATCLALNAYMLKREAKYKSWILEYVDAWRERALRNKGILPTNIGLDGTIGGGAGGKWYGGVYGWGFSVVVPQDGSIAHRNNIYLGLAGFTNAFLLTADDRYLDVWRRQIDLVNAQKKVVDGAALYPTMYGDKGWYNYKPDRYQHGALDLYYLSMKSEDRQRVERSAWLDYLEGKNPGYAESALRGDLERIRQRVQKMRSDASTPDTRLADDTLKLNPASIHSLVELMMAGLPTGNRKLVLHSRLRYFDPARRRAGMPADVAALVEKMTADSVTVTLVNTNPVESRRLIVQAGTHAEHQFSEAGVEGKTVPVDAPALTIDLAAGAGTRLVLKMRRFVNQPTWSFPVGL
jgi:hypothetical protein